MAGYNYCAQCRRYVTAAEIGADIGGEFHSFRSGGCGGPVFACTEEEFWGTGLNEFGGVGHEERVETGDEASALSE